jgi:hypothetical protein
MNSTPDEILRDPLFQLNALLWLSQPLPTTYEITPLLYEQGFTVYSLSPLFGLPPDLQLTAQNAQINMQRVARPDVVLRHEGDHKFAFTECKASSFSVESSTARQARTLLVIAGPRSAEILGLGIDQVSSSLLAFMVPENECEQSNQTLRELCLELDENHLPIGQFCTLGLLLTKSDISIVVDNVGGEFFKISPGSYPFIRLDQDTDPRPFYFIPYDPDVSQSRREEAFCKRILFERIHSAIVAAVGRANPPVKLLLKSPEILNDAMFGVYGRWENRESRKHMRKLCRQLMNSLAEAVNSVATDAIVVKAVNTWSICLEDEEQHEVVKDTLANFSCEQFSLRDETSPDLLDLMDNRKDEGTVNEKT